ncbi:MAG: class I SAM-dependent RNA methyltransferase [Rhodospirillales bacterium]|nr:class I SAM-dependent RNA methyltransferase [Rhodospirillales bacterium]
MASKKQPPKPQPILAGIKITHLGGRGDGIGEVAGERVFVPYALPGEEVRAMVTGNRAVVEEIVKSSPKRIEPFCPHFTHCGGCAAQHIDQDTYRSWKKGIIEVALANKGLDAPVDDLIDAHGAGRRRVTLHVRFEKGRVRAGFMQARRHELLDLDHCPVLVPALSGAADIARALAAPFTAQGEALDVRITASESGLDCDIRLNGKRAEVGLDARMDLAEIATELDLARVTVDGDLIVERRPPGIRMGAGRVVPPPGGFLQATQAGEDALAALVLGHAGSARRIADLFCGVGPFALRLAAQASVLAADADEAQITALANAVRYCQGLKPLTTEVRDLFRNPYTAWELSGFDCAVFDPPRAGAQVQVREITAAKVPIVIAVSCDPASFARDAAILCAGGYRLERVSPVDQFKYTRHVELVGVFRQG